MKKLIKGTFITIFIIAFSFIIAQPQAEAAEWSAIMGEINTASGLYGTIVYTDLAFPSGNTYANILNTATGHSRMLALVLTAVSLDLSMRFYIDDSGNIVQAVIYKP